MRNIFRVALLLFICAVSASAATPTLKRSYGKEGMSSNSTDKADDFIMQLDSSPATTVPSIGDVLTVEIKLPKADTPTVTDNTGSNTWVDVLTTTCEDTNYRYTLVYAVLAAVPANIKIHTGIGGGISDISFSVQDWYNMGASALADGTSCSTAITPANNTPPNITATSVTVGTGGDLVITSVFNSNFAAGDNTPSGAFTAGSGWTFIQESWFFGNLTEYQVPGSSGALAVTATIPQTVHDAFAIIAISLKSGAGGAAPGAGIGISNSQTVYVQAIGTVNVTITFPIATTGDGVAVCNDAGNVGSNLNSVTDSVPNTYTLVVSAAQFPECFFQGNLTASATYTVILHFNSAAGNDLVYIADMKGVTTAPLDTTAAAANSSTLTGAGSGATAGNNPFTSTANVAFTDEASIIPGTATGIVIDSGQSGLGPTTASTGASEYAYELATWGTGGDNNGLTNGDMMAVKFHSTNAIINFGYTTAGASALDALAVSFKGAAVGTSGGGGFGGTAGIGGKAGLGD